MCMTPAILAFIFADDVGVPRGTVVRTNLNKTVNLIAEYESASGCVATRENYWLLDEAAETRVYNTCLSVDYSAPGRHLIRFMKLEPPGLCSPTAGMASIDVLIDVQ